MVIYGQTNKKHQLAVKQLAKLL